MQDMTDKLVESLSSDISARIAAARNALLAEMHALGLSTANGWRVVEELRHTLQGTEWTFRPMHIRELPPEDLRSSVVIDHEGRAVSR
jgi:hypothetical protein